MIGSTVLGQGLSLLTSSLLSQEPVRMALRTKETRLQMIYMEHEGHQKGSQPRK